MRSVPGPAGANSVCSSDQVRGCGTNTAFSPAASAGLMSLFGEFPIIHVMDGTS